MSRVWPRGDGVEPRRSHGTPCGWGGVEPRPRGGARPRGILLAIALFALLGSVRLPAENLDLVVMVDTSASMFPYFDDLMNYLVKDLLTQRLHRGDTFHLLSFSSVPEMEISLALTSQTAAEQAFGRLLLLHALGRYTDLVAALQYLYKYVKELPAANPKQIILLTDGVHDPPPESQYRGSPESVQAAIDQIAQSMKSEGWTLNILRVPPKPAPGEEGLRSYLDELGKVLGVPVVPYRPGDKQNVTGRATGFPSLTFPADLGRVGNRFVATFRIKNWSSDPILLTLSGVQSDGIELLSGPVSVSVPAGGEAPLDAALRLPLSYPRGQQSIQVRLLFRDDVRISPTEGMLSFFYTGRGGLALPRLTFLYVVYIVLGLALVYLLVRLFLALRTRLREVPVSGLAARTAQPSRAPIPAAAKGAEPRAGKGPGRKAAALRVPAAVAAAPGAAPEPAPQKGRPAPTRRGAPEEAAGPVASEARTGAGAPFRPGAAAPIRPGAAAPARPAAAEARPPAAPARPAIGPVPRAPAGASQAPERRLAPRREVTVRRAQPTLASIRRALPGEQLQRSMLPPLIEMRVDEQNTHIGFRNVHRIASGSSRSVGGGFSSFLVFLVPMPRSIAEIRNENGTFVFTPLRAELFPDVPGPIEGCLDREIPFVSPKGMPLTLIFRTWVSPLDEVNAILRQTRPRGD